jgi:hypothetical protein
MMVLLPASCFLGGAVLLATVLGIALPRLRWPSVMVGSAGLLAGTLAALVYTLVHMAEGTDIDFIPHEPAALWFVAAYGWAGLLAALAIALRTRSRRDAEPPARLRRVV